MLNHKEIDKSTDGRYTCFNQKLGIGAYKVVWLGYDHETGREVAWNTVDLKMLPSNEQTRIRSETDILRGLKHDNIIDFFHVWEVPGKEQICFTTERVTSGTLKAYVKRIRPKLKVIKDWCRQILTGLAYLHTHDPIIIHRDLKCDNIFINGSTNTIRIGDFGLSSTRHSTHVQSVLGTPEFMAPELYNESYNELVDIYAFGMCVIEMVSGEYPYQECNNAVQIWKKVTNDEKPNVLTRIKNHKVKAFIDMCILPLDVRPSAEELLSHPFLSFKHTDPLDDHPVEVVAEEESNDEKNGGKDCAKIENISVEGTYNGNGICFIVLYIHFNNFNKKKKIQFYFDFEKDSSTEVAEELANVLTLDDSYKQIAKKIDETTVKWHSIWVKEKHNKQAKTEVKDKGTRVLEPRRRRENDKENDSSSKRNVDQRRTNYSFDFSTKKEQTPSDENEVALQKLKDNLQKETVRHLKARILEIDSEKGKFCVEKRDLVNCLLEILPSAIDLRNRIKKAKEGKKKDENKLHNKKNGTKTDLVNGIKKNGINDHNTAITDRTKKAREKQKSNQNKNLEIKKSEPEGERDILLSLVDTLGTPDANRKPQISLTTQETQENDHARQTARQKSMDDFKKKQSVNLDEFEKKLDKMKTDFLEQQRKSFEEFCKKV